MKRKANLKWNVLRYDFNSKSIVNFNIFNQEFIKELNTAVRLKEVINILELNEYIDKWARYNYWFRAEHEIYVSGIHEESAEKIDVYRQINMNLDIITDYVNNKLKIFK